MTKGKAQGDKRPKQKKGGEVDDENEAEAKRRGNPGGFHGARLEFLRARVEEFCKHSADSTTRGWWKGVWKDYWQQFPWTLALDEEPPEDISTYVVKPDTELTAEEMATKNKTKEDTQAKIKRWFSYARISKSASNPFAKWISQLRRVDEQAPRRLALYQSYMQDDDALAKINDVFKERYPELVGKKNRIKERGQIARELLAAETEEYRNELKARVDEEFEAAMEEYKTGDSAAAAEVKDPALQQEARERLAVTVQPLLDSLRALTGSHVLLVTGTVIDGKFDVRTLQAKAPGTQGLKLSAWDSRGFKNIMDQWMRYLVAGGKYVPCYSRPTAHRV
ncbi:hypothetical protein R3P38DRAFT_2551498 [Favolaschia claudopus]|uniref:Uncharacterized protein n=1 Tax=Favolaschia claudopus TaxID=2862362 RepID=A0AAW0AJI3_9AGAR